MSSATEPQLFTQASQAFESGNLSKALRLFARLTKNYPKNPDHHFNLGVVYAQQNQIPKAIQAYRKTLALQWDHGDANNNLAVLLNQQGKHHQAIKHLTKALVFNPKHIHYLLNLAKTYATLNRPNQAVNFLKRAITEHPNFSLAHFELGQQYLSLKRSKQAMHHFSQAATISPTFSLAHYNLALLLLAQHQYDMSTTHLEQALNHQPGNPHIALELAKVHLHQDRIKLCRKVIRFSLKHNPNSIELLFTLNTTYLLENKLHPALQLSRKLFKLAPNYLPNLISLYHLEHSHLNFQKLNFLNQQIVRLSQVFDYKSDKYPENPTQSTLRVDPNQSLIIAENWYQHLPKIPHQATHQARHLPTLALNLDSLNDTKNLGIVDSITNLNQSKLNTFSFSTYHTLSTSKHNSFSPNVVFSNQDHQTIIGQLEKVSPTFYFETSGWSNPKHLQLAFSNPAPIIFYHSLPLTLGSSPFNYLIADDQVIPPTESTFITETQLALPHTFLTISPGTTSNTPLNNSLSLTQPSYTFTKGLLKLITKTPQDTQIFLQPHSKSIKEALNLKLASPSQHHLTFLSNSKSIRAKQLNRISLAIDGGVSFDPTLNLEHLAQGVPIVTLLGNSTLNRITPSFLISAGISELITHSASDLAQITSKLLTNPTKLRRLRRKLSRHQACYPLFSPKRLAHNLETGLLQAYDSLISNRHHRISIADPYPLISATQ